MNYLMPFLGEEGPMCIFRHTAQGLKDNQSTHYLRAPSHLLAHLLLMPPEGIGTHHSHSTSRETEAQRSRGIFANSLSG